MTTTDTIHTAEGLARMPDDGMQRELVGGELRSMPPAGRSHGFVENAFLRAFYAYVDEHDFGVVTTSDIGYLITRKPDTVLAPDAAIIRQDRAEAAPEDSIYWALAPDIAVEVLSPNDRASEVGEKIDLWLRAGVKMLCIADPNRRTVTVYRPGHETIVLRNDDVLDGADVLPGFHLTVRAAFAKK